MDEWLRSLVDGALGPIRATVDAVAKRLSSVWSVISTFLGLVRTQWRKLRVGVESWVETQIRHAAAVATTLRWLVFVYVPRQLGALAVSIRTWTADLILRVESKAMQLFNTAMTWASTHIQSALNIIGSIRQWAIGQFNSLIDTTSRMAKLVFGVLSTPERLAEWIVAAMFDSLMAYGRKNLHRVESFVAAHRGFIWRAVISVLEDVFTELL